MPSAKTQAASRPWGTIHGLVLYPRCKWVWGDATRLPEGGSPDFGGAGVGPKGGQSLETEELGRGRPWRGSLGPPGTGFRPASHTLPA